MRHKNWTCVLLFWLGAIFFGIGLGSTLISAGIILMSLAIIDAPPE